MSHLLSLICTADLKKKNTKISRSTFAKCQGIWNKIGRSVKANEEIFDIIGKTLPKPCETRWNSLFDCSMALIKSKEKLDDICSVLKIPVLTEREKQFLEDYCSTVENCICCPYAAVTLI